MIARLRLPRRSDALAPSCANPRLIRIGMPHGDKSGRNQGGKSHGDTTPSPTLRRHSSGGDANRRSGLSSAARAEVIYRIEEVAFGSLSFDATLKQPSFITSDITVPISDFTVAVNASPPFINVVFDPLSSSHIVGGCPTYGQPTPCDLVDLIASNGSSPFYFSPHALETPGVYTATGGAFEGILTVSSTAVPEPATWAMMLLGFAGLGLVGYRRTASTRAATV